MTEGCPPYKLKYKLGIYILYIIKIHSNGIMQTLDKSFSRQAATQPTISFEACKRPEEVSQSKMLTLTFKKQVTLQKLKTYKYD